MNDSEHKTKFTLERLLGVETSKGFVVDLDNRGALFVGNIWYHPNGVRYYISDDSDETVSFEEYIKLFYNTGDTL